MLRHIRTGRVKTGQSSNQNNERSVIHKLNGEQLIFMGPYKIKAYNSALDTQTHTYIYIYIYSLCLDFKALLSL